MFLSASRSAASCLLICICHGTDVTCSCTLRTIQLCARVLVISGGRTDVGATGVDLDGEKQGGDAEASEPEKKDASHVVHLGGRLGFVLSESGLSLARNLVVIGVMIPL